MGGAKRRDGGECVRGLPPPAGGGTVGLPRNTLKCFIGNSYSFNTGESTDFLHIVQVQVQFIGIKQYMFIANYKIFGGSSSNNLSTTIVNSDSKEKFDIVYQHVQHGVQY